MRAPRFASASAAVATLLLAGSRASDAQDSRRDDQMERPEVRSLVLRGANSVDQNELLQSIATSQSRCKGIVMLVFCPLTHSQRFWKLEYLDRTELRRDMLRIKVFYWKRGFREAQVDTVLKPRGREAVDVTFRIDEGRPTLL